MRSSSLGESPIPGPRALSDVMIAAFELGRARLRLGNTRAKNLLADHPATLPHRRDDERDRQQIARVSVAIGRVAHRLPWRSDCLVQAIAAQQWLARHGLQSRVAIGVREPGSPAFEAHAWLLCGEAVVTGGDVAGYTPLRQPES